MGNTARMMANRRKTIGAKDSGAVSPLNPSTPSDEVRKSFSSPPLQGEMQETPRAAINAEKLGWKDESPVQAIARNWDGKMKVQYKPSRLIMLPTIRSRPVRRRLHAGTANHP